MEPLHKALGNDSDRNFADSIEGNARDATSSVAGRALTDAEWGRVQNRLLEFVAILRGWDQAAKTGDAR
jgi:hypothetical protein